MSAECRPGLVSVIVPTYNRRELLAEAMGSVEAQTYRPIELLVVDDGSTDDTEAAVRELGRRADASLAVRYLRQARAGMSAARNLGLIESQGEYVQYLDSDDLLHPEKIARQANALRRDPGLGFVWSDSAQFRGTPSFDARPFTGGPGGDLIRRYARRIVWHPMSGIYRRSACVRVGPWNEAFRRYEDWEYNLRFLAHGPRCAYLPGVLSLYRVHALGQSRDFHRTPEGLRSDLAGIRAVEAALLETGAVSRARVGGPLAGHYVNLCWRAGAIGLPALSREALAGAKRCACGGGSLLEIALFEQLWHGAGLSAASLVFRMGAIVAARVAPLLSGRPLP
jgi:glycosyltransferase involved in cell wall biosynthesis